MNNSPEIVTEGAAPARGLGSILSPDLLVLHALADAVVALALIAMAAAIYIFMWRRQEMTAENRREYLILGTVLLMIGISFAASFATLFADVFLLEGVTAALTALVALLMAVMIWRALPRELRRPSPAAMEEANRALRAAQDAREMELRALELSQHRLERLAAERNRELIEIGQRFEAATSSAQITVLAQDRDLTFTWVHNPWPGLTAADFLGRQPEHLPIAPLAEALARHGRRVMETGKAETFELETVGPDSVTSWFRVTVTPLRDGDGRAAGLVSTAIDISGPKRLEAMRADLSRRLAETVQRFNLALRSSYVLVFSLNAALGELWANTDDPQLRAILGADGGVDEAERPLIAAVMREAMESRHAQYREISVGEGDQRAWYDLHIEPRFSAAGATVGVVCAAVNVTQRKRDEQRMRLVMRELSHRSKNLLAVVQAIARQTAQQATGVAAFVESFGQRLRALAGAQDLLVAENWAGARLDGLIMSQIGHYLPEEDRASVQGPPVTLTPEATQTIALALHELATNAVKHGALSNETGIVRVNWSLGDDILELRWEEIGGPPIGEPARKGFGRVVIEFNVARSLNADVSLQFPAGGALAVFRIPRQHIVEARSQENLHQHAARAPL